jgi:lipopolysaccharide transport system ATP-binding protein
MVLDEGQLVMRGSTPESVDYYMTSGIYEVGQRYWDSEDGRVSAAAPFRPLTLQVEDSLGQVTGQVSTVEGFSIVFEYELDDAITGLRVGLYLSTSRGERVLTSFDTDDETSFERYTVRQAGRYQSRCFIPPDMLNGGSFVLGVNASSYRIRSYFTDEHALSFNVDSTGAPGSHWPEHRRGPIRPALNWNIEEVR